jgi:hypothetical protein
MLTHPAGGWPYDPTDMRGLTLQHFHFQCGHPMIIQRILGVVACAHPMQVVGTCCSRNLAAAVANCELRQGELSLGSGPCDSCMCVE